jgi:glutamate 5-kinase
MIADAARPGVLVAAVAGESGVGTVFRARPQRLSARKLWIAFALGASGRLIVDEGAQVALAERGRSLLPAGVVAAEGDFGPEDAVEIVGPDGKVFAKGLVRMGASRSAEWIGRHTNQLPEDMSHLVIHRDDLVLVR